MAVIVQKYGGSSVAGVQKLKEVAGRVMRTRHQGHQVVVVVSAMGDALVTCFQGRAELIDGLAAVSVIGVGINATYANVRTGSQALTDAGIHPASTSTSSFRITWMIPRDRTEDAVRLLHYRFIESQTPLVP